MGLGTIHPDPSLTPTPLSKPRDIDGGQMHPPRVVVPIIADSARAFYVTLPELYCWGLSFNMWVTAGEKAANKGRGGGNGLRSLGQAGGYWGSGVGWGLLLPGNLNRKVCGVVARSLGQAASSGAPAIVQRSEQGGAPITVAANSTPIVEIIAK